MTLKDDPNYKHLKQALEALAELQVPENLQKTALEYLLRPATGVTAPIAAVPSAPAAPPNLPAASLRAFIADMKPKGAVAEIPCLIYWAKMEDKIESLDEKGVIELYRRAGLRPPKNVAQSLRDLCSKRYGRLEAVPGKNGHVSLSRVGEDFVLHDVKS